MVTFLSGIARLGIGILWSIQIGYVVCFSKEDEDGIQDRKDLAYSSILYSILLTLCP